MNAAEREASRNVPPRTVPNPVLAPGVMGKRLYFQHAPPVASPQPVCPSLLSPPYSSAGGLPEGGPAPASAVDRIQGRRMPFTKEEMMSEAEAIAIERGDRMTLARLIARRQCDAR